MSYEVPLVKNPTVGQILSYECPSDDSAAWERLTPSCIAADIASQFGPGEYYVQTPCATVEITAAGEWRWSLVSDDEDVSVCWGCGQVIGRWDLSYIRENPNGYDIAHHEAWLEHVSGPCPNSSDHDHIEVCDLCGAEIGRWDAAYAEHNDNGLGIAIYEARARHREECPGEWREWRDEVREYMRGQYISAEARDLLKEEFEANEAAALVAKELPSHLADLPTPPNSQDNPNWPWLWVADVVDLQKVRRRLEDYLRKCGKADLIIAAVSAGIKLD